jgi:branched-subunit amino acid transport protein
MADVWITIAALAVTTAMIRASGPLAVGNREVPERFNGIIDLLGPALLTALIVTQTLGGDRSIEVSASIAGVAAAAAVLLRHRSAMLSAIVVAALVTALVRALT